MQSQPVAARPDQQIEPDLVAELLGVIRGQFCSDMEAGKWYQLAHFIKRRAILWPAWWIKEKKGFTLSEKRYSEIMRSIFSDVKRHCTQDVRFWPGYLVRCIQDHWKHNWETYYEEAKSTRNLAESTLVALGRIVPAQRTVDALALAHQVLASKRRKKVETKPSTQLGLL